MSVWEKDGMDRRIFLKMSALWTSAAALGAANEALATRADSKAAPDEYDAVIIGSGLGGLACAGYLAKRGLKTLVVEQQRIPGGYASSFTRAGGRFTFDVSLHHIVIHGVCRQVLEELQVLDRVKFHRCNQLYRLVAQDIDVTCRSNGAKGLEELLVGMFPSQERGIKGFIGDMVGVSKEVDRIFAAGKEAEGRRANFQKEFPFLMATRNKTLADYLNAHVSDPKLRAILSVSCGSYGLPPDTLSGFYYLCAFGSRVRYGASYPEGGSQAMSDAIAEFIENHGGEIRFNTRVEKVLVKNGKVAGVSTSDGETIRARTVVANCSAARLFNEMIDPGTLPTDYRDRIRSFKPSASSFVVWLALNKDITSRVTDSHIALKSGPAGRKGSFQSGLRGDMENASLGVCIYNNIYRAYSPPGTTVMTITSICGYEPFRPFERDYFAREKDAYNKKKAEMAQAMIKRVEDQLIPGLSGMIEVQEAATPLTNVRYTLNTAGAIYGYEQSVANTFMNRISNRTPVKGLYLAGAWGEPGGGYGAVLSSGKKTFGMIMQDWKGA